MNLEAAISLAHQWAARGFPSFPVAIGWDPEKGHTSKRPLTLHGHTDATTDKQELIRSFNAGATLIRKGEELGVGILPGKAGYIILDADMHQYDGVSYVESLGASTTFIVDTASNGEHRFFKKPPGMRFGNQIPQQWKGLIDIRSDAGWIVAPGVTTSWGSWDARVAWESVTIPVLPPDIVKVLQVMDDTHEQVGHGGRYVPEKHDEALGEQNVATLKIMVEKYGADIRKATVHQEQRTDEITGDKYVTTYLKICRPGKSAGVSGTIGYVNPGVVYIFTTEWEGLQNQHSYDPEELLSNGAKEGRVHVRGLNEVEFKEVVWVWENRLATGTLSLLAGREGLGKSMVGYWLAAQLTQGLLPGIYYGEPRAVFVVATEDSYAHVVGPRLAAAGANLHLVKQVYVDIDAGIEGDPSLPRDVAEIRRLAEELRPALLLLDPLMSRVDVKMDTHRDADVRRALEPLTSMLTGTGMCCLGIMHFNKSGGNDPLNSIMASKAFTAVARSVNAVAPHPEQEGEAIFGTIKNNLGPSLSLPSLGFRVTGATVEQGGKEFPTAKLEWLGEHEGSIADAMDATRHGAGKSARQEAKEFLLEYMTDNAGPGGWIPRKEIKAAAKFQDISWDACEDIRPIMKIQTQRQKVKGGLAQWRLPGYDALDGLVEE